MKIINWNVGRPSRPKAKLILDKLNELDGDIVVLTETNSSIIQLSGYHLVATDPLPRNFDGYTYNEGENRTSIWTKYPVTGSHRTFDGHTSICSDIATPFGPLTVYATIIGIVGGKGQRFQDDLNGQLSDFDTILTNRQGCIIGDYNIAFSGYAYPSHQARQTLNDVFEKFKLTNLTAAIPDCVDHIAIDSEYLKGKHVTLDTWIIDRTIKDHFGTSITLTDPHA